MIYFDNAASSYPKPESVAAAVAFWLRKNGANPGRSGHRLSLEAGELVYDTRKMICDIFGADEPECVAFVPNATYGLNMLIQGLLHSGDHAVTTDLEHNSVLRPLKLLSERGVEFDVAKVDLYNDNRTVQNILDKIKENTKLIVCTQCSNVCGKVMPLRQISGALPDSVRLVVDGAQGAGIVPINLKRDGIDYYCAPSHKGIMGPQGCGFVVVLNDAPMPLIVGGTGSESFSLSQPDYLPDLLESGTLPTPVISGMKEGLKFIKNVGIEKIFAKKISLVRRMYAELDSVEGVIKYIDPEKSLFAGVACFNIEGSHSDSVAAYLAENGVCVRSGIHCAPLFHRKMGTEKIGMVRASFGYYNTINDINSFIKILKKY